MAVQLCTMEGNQYSGDNDIIVPFSWLIDGWSNDGYFALGQQTYYGYYGSKVSKMCNFV